MSKVARKKTSSRSAAKPKKKSTGTRSTRSTARSARKPQPQHRTTKRRPAKAQAPNVFDSIEDLIDKLGDQFEPVLYSLLCEDKHDMRSTLTNALGRGSQAATLALVPLLVSQFTLTPALAAVVVGTVAKALVTKGPEALCEELSRAREERARKERRSAARHKASAHSKKGTRRR